MRTIKILMTFGPASAPIDQVRRITNHSTGSLGNAMGRYFLDQNHELIALRGEGATTPSSFPFYSFKTNLDLEKLLLSLSSRFQPDLILHAAALSDYEVESLSAEHADQPLSASKISSQHSRLTICLKKAPKILPQLRDLFPQSTVISWKYELEGTCLEAIKKAQQQVIQKQSDFSIINGKAYGEGFGICNAHEVLHSHLNPLELSQKILTLLLVK